MNRRLFFIPIIGALVIANDGACSRETDADRAEREGTERVTGAAVAAVGMPAIHNFYEKRLLREIYERRDQANLTTYAYLQGMDGRLTCLGRAIGYGVPYSTQFTNPQRTNPQGYQGPNMLQPEPNGLFPAEGQQATWLQLVDPASGQVSVVYVEPNVTVSPFRLRGPVVAQDCPA